MTPEERLDEIEGLERLREDLYVWLAGEEARERPDIFWLHVKTLVSVLHEIDLKTN